MNTNEWDEVLAFWFPEGVNPDIDAKTHQAHWHWRMQGGADDEISARFANLTEQVAKGVLDHWAKDAYGRLALIVILDQFSRSVWRGTKRAFAQDPRALELANEGIVNGHYASLAMPWFQAVHGLPFGHCEGPDHLARIDRLIGLREEIAADAPVQLQPIYASLVAQVRDVHKVIASFGRHPHRNAVLARASTPAEELYIAKGAFPHRKAFQKD